MTQSPVERVRGPARGDRTGALGEGFPQEQELGGLIFMAVSLLLAPASQDCAARRARPSSR